MGRCVKCGNEVTGAVCGYCGTPVQNNAGNQNKQFMGQPNQFGGQQPFGQPNRFGGQQPQPFGQPSQFGGPQPYGQQDRVGGLGIASTILILLNAAIVLIVAIIASVGIQAALRAEVRAESLFYSDVSINPVYTIIFVGAHVLLAVIAVVMITGKKSPGPALVMVIMQSVLVIVSFIIAAAIVGSSDAFSLQASAFELYRTGGGSLAVVLGAEIYLAGCLIGSLFWIAGLITSIVATATHKKR